jgi:hypothetical protein
MRPLIAALPRVLFDWLAWDFTNQACLTLAGAVWVWLAQHLANQTEEKLCVC